MMTKLKLYRKAVEGVVDARRAFLKKAAAVGKRFNIVTVADKTAIWKIQTS